MVNSIDSTHGINIKLRHDVLLFRISQLDKVYCNYCLCLFVSWAVLFGGRTRTGRVSELYIFNFDTTTWTGPFTTENGPQPRSLHTCTRLHDNSVLLLGGMDKAGNSVDLQWKLKTATAVPTWERVNLCPAAHCGRTWHTTAVHTTSNCSEILVFGGSPDNIWEPDHAYWANMVRFYYGVRPLYDMCLDAISDTSEASEYPLIDLDIESR
eukprot:sb/3470244/